MEEKSTPPSPDEGQDEDAAADHKNKKIERLEEELKTAKNAIR
jgi:hypothetical protein